MSVDNLLEPSSIKSDLKIPKQIIETDVSNFRENFNSSHFMFSHNLAGHPLFEIPRLVELANTMLSQGRTNKIQSYISKVPVEQKWNQRPGIKQINEAIAHIGESDSWVMLEDVQADPEYAALINQIITELETLTGRPLRKQMTWLGAYIFIGSPNSITPYHIDSELNFLFQIQGEKDMSLFNQSDRSVLSEEEVEKFYVGDLNVANYKEENQSKATVYHLQPGKGLHHPILAPHWAKNSNNVSVALSILFYLRPYDLKARIYQVNSYLRRLGLKPTPPDKSALKDRLKIFALGLLSDRQPKSKFMILRSGVLKLKSIEGKLKQFINKIVKKS
ncbi:MAG: cupin-like domain-containing protein [Nostoc sp. DedSLP03]|uniref:cupin-like domain-containing protein n=1 Tax=Nostoc sp. DedSLP03 TaxID=3075400 RepID=UPI002AD4B569|nr:cupin-like domain-containing protein [Nostoc sp. DedSLP03]MDZ7969595.1 cupin-like domain-containing protein [Nostoc sp. DedSLP03]